MKTPPKLPQDMPTDGELYLISEYCASPFYMGWHLYLRDNKNRQQRNADGEWGWLRRSSCALDHAHKLLKTLGIHMDPKGDGTCDYDGYAELARMFPIPRQRIGKKPRGCIAVVKDENGELSLAKVEGRS